MYYKQGYITRYNRQKWFLKSREGFLKDALIGHSQPGPYRKIAKMALFNPCMDFEFFWGPNDFIWGAIKVPFFNFIQKMSQALSSSVQVLIWEDKLDYLNNPSQDFKNSFCLWFLWIFSNAGRQNWRGPVFLRFNLVK